MSSSSVACLFPQRKFSLIVPEKRTFFVIPLRLHHVMSLNHNPEHRLHQQGHFLRLHHKVLELTGQDSFSTTGAANNANCFTGLNLKINIL